MDIKPKEWSIYQIIERKKKINPQPQYQRTPVWTEKKKQLLIDSILRRYDLPKFYLRSSDPPYEHEIVDGQQRLRAIWEFRNDQYRLRKTSKEIPDYDDLSGKKWSELSSDQKDKIGNFPLTIVEIKDASNEQVEELFSRLQEGVVLNPAEKRNAMSGEIRDFVAKLGETHSVFPLIRINNKRFAWHNLAAIVTCLEEAGGPTDVKAQNLYEMYERINENFDVNGPVAKKVRHHLNYMTRVLKDRPPEMNIKWGFVDLYLLISKMHDSYAIRGREADFTNFYIAFEKARREVISDHSQLLSSNRDSWDRDLYNYIEAFNRSGGMKQNITERHKVYKRRFIRDTKGLVLKDPQRDFTYDERLMIWRRDNETCQECHKKITFDEMQADHISSHTDGGETTLDNAQTLCGECNARKGAN